ncbi:CoA transferase [Arthrobacter sp. 2RAF6]|uniref:CoA transferase n=1 Tax=Arthrobacter sp. 2RAF6 TaxID=3233002 RepID=UPI003F8D9CEC
MFTPPISAASSDFPIAKSFLREIWNSLGGEAPALERVTFHNEGDLSSPFPVADFAAATFAAAGLSASQLIHDAGLGAPEVRVDRKNATTWFDFPIAPSRLIDEPLPHGIHSKWMVEFQTRDAQWIRVQATYPTLRQRLFGSLEIKGDLKDVAEALSGLNADEAENRLIAGGAAAAVARSLDDWRHHPQGAAVAREPIAACEDTLMGVDSWRPTPGRPLLGVRVLDLTRVVAGPMATRYLAALGAEVLRLDAPNSDEVLLGKANDIVLGKRWALLDIKTPEGREHFKKLLASTDVLVHGYRPGALDRLGFDQETRSSLRPGLVEVALCAYGWTGPWRERRGFDTLVQFSSGIAHEVSRWANQDPDRRLPLNALGHSVDATRPRHLPVEALDFGTGYQLAAAVLEGLRRRMNTGLGSVTKMSLARSAALLANGGSPQNQETFDLPIEADFLDDRIYSMGGRASQRLPFPLTIENTPHFWDRISERPGSSAPTWSYDRP